MRLRGCFLALVCCAAGSLLHAQVPDLIHYQGKLVMGTNLYSGTTNISFRLFDAPTGGAFPTYEDSGTVTAVDGLYSTFIGDNTVWGDLTVALNNTQVWIEVVIGTNVLTPRERMAAVGFARVAQAVPANAIQAYNIAAGEVYGYHISNGEITGEKIDSGTISNVHLAAGSITGDKIAAFSISNSALAFGAVSGSVIEDGAVGYLDLASDAVRSNRIDWSRMPPGLQDGDDGQSYTAGAGLGIAGAVISVTNGGIDTAQLTTSAVGSNEIDWAAMPPGLEQGIRGYRENGTFASSPQASGNNAIALGSGNETQADDSNIAGGKDNFIDVAAAYSAIGGGYNNTIGTVANYAIIAGGTANLVEPFASYSQVIGGFNNGVGYNAWYSSVVGGKDNVVGTNSFYSIIGGGEGNGIHRNVSHSGIEVGRFNEIRSNSLASVIGGGQDNIIGQASTNMFIGAGNNNYVFGPAENAGIVAGDQNLIQYADNAAILGGSRHNIWDAEGATVAGGRRNQIWSGADRSFIGGGDSNLVASGSQDSFIGAGAENLIDAYRSFIGAGYQNTVDGSTYGSIVGGWYNRLYTGSMPFIGGGSFNVISNSADWSAILGGNENSIGIDANYAAVLGGQKVKIADGADYAVAGGRRARADHYGSLVLADAQDTDFHSAGANTFNTRYSGGHYFSDGADEVVIKGGNVGIGTATPTSGVEIASGEKITVNGSYEGFFPKPAWDSGWLNMNRAGTSNFVHNVGGNTDNYIVDLQFKDADGWGVNNFSIGHATHYDALLDEIHIYGMYYRNLSSTDITIASTEGAFQADQVRIRIWRTE